MKICCLIILIFFLSFSYGWTNEELNEHVSLTKKEYLQLVVGAYVWGFNEFDTSIVIFENLVRIGIYYDIDRQNKELADSLKRRFELHIPNLLRRITWAKGYKVDVNVYGETRLKRGY